MNSPGRSMVAVIVLAVAGLAAACGGRTTDDVPDSDGSTSPTGGAGASPAGAAAAEAAAPGTAEEGGAGPCPELADVIQANLACGCDPVAELVEIRPLPDDPCVLPYPEGSGNPNWLIVTVDCEIVPMQTGPDEPGWRYDSPASPQHVIIEGPVCEALHANDGAVVRTTDACPPIVCD